MTTLLPGVDVEIGPVATDRWITPTLIAEAVHATWPDGADTDPWLLVYRTDDLPRIDWSRGPAPTARLDEGFRSRRERLAAYAEGRRTRDGLPRMGHRERLATPPAFRDLLLSIARSAVRP